MPERADELRTEWSEGTDNTAVRERVGSSDGNSGDENEEIFLGNCPAGL